ncbi:Peptidoglycan-binding LysM domain-containing protein, putative isoform 1 [Cinnamomum micranthum f. kanehirae]|uniref:Peptidoglycan-binding LysM domain-containing protein, putative isoform 1 n=1 Tax=Cinnamomum micranthum f. kanehirae TaxID=337451 RepID=A0A443NJU0_9MAGN|nr:Peptidoglycan-binding LysM domain-containing protein, putative isoform 1 [Cinnamomum micranthum f. kanehirae]
MQKRNGDLQIFSDDSVVDGVVARRSGSSASNHMTMVPGVNYIEHQVSKMDTLAGLAIKYGVEVADIKRMNGLVTDLQMYALKSLQIPLPGRHPPSPILSNGSAGPGDQSTEQTPTHRSDVDILNSFQSLKKSTPRRVSPAMSSLHGYYGLTPLNKKGAAEGTEMAVYKTNRALDLEDKRPSKSSPPTGWPPRSRSLANGFSLENGEPVGMVVADSGDSEVEISNEKPVWRRHKLDLGPASPMTELLLKEDSSGGFSGITGKGLALRPKSASRASLVADADSGRINSVPMAESFPIGSLFGVRKSSSTSNLQDSEDGRSTSKWNLKPDLQGLSTAAITRPIFDGLPKPITGRRKAALD